MAPPSCDEPRESAVRPVSAGPWVRLTYRGVGSREAGLGTRAGDIGHELGRRYGGTTGAKGGKTAVLAGMGLVTFRR